MSQNSERAVDEFIWSRNAQPQMVGHWASRSRVSEVSRKLLLILASLLMSVGCFDQSTRVPDAPVVAGGVTSCSGQHGVFLQSGDMKDSRADHTATILPDGKVLFAGGYSSSTYVEDVILDSSEVYDPSDRSFHETGKMTSARSEASATQLPDGRVLITGGFDQGRYVGLGGIPRVPISTTEIFDTKSNLFTASSPMLTARYAHSSVLLDNGKVLIAGGSCQPERFFGILWGGACSPELYDPKKGTFSNADPSGAGHNEERALALVDGKVLLFCAGTSAELYDSKSGRFTRTGDMRQRMDSCRGNLLKDGRVLVLGMTREGDTMRAVPVWREQIYDPKSGSFSWLEDPPLKIYEPVTAPIDGVGVLLSGDVRPDYENVLSSVMFDSATNQYSVVGSQHPLRDGFTATRLSDGTILIAGGMSGSLPYNVQRAIRFCP
jgi:hypothetical protein